MRMSSMPRSLVVAVVVARGAMAQTPMDSIVPPSPAPNGFIADGGPVLDAAAKARLNARISDVQRTTGGDIGVAVVRDLHGRAPVDVGVAIYRAWRIGRIDSIGSARRALGALLLIVPKEMAPDNRGHCWITTGRGAEGELIDSKAGDICRDSVTPRLKARDYAAAISGGIDGIAATYARTVAGLPAPTSVAPPNETPASKAPWMLAGLFGLVTAGVGAVKMKSIRRNRARRCPKGHGKMERLTERADNKALSQGQRVEERLKSVDYDVWECATCHERIVLPYPRRSGHENCPSCGFKTVKSKFRTIVPASTLNAGLGETERICANCNWHDSVQREIPMIVVVSSSSSSSDSGSSWSSSDSGSSSSSSDFGGSGDTSGGGGGDSY